MANNNGGKIFLKILGFLVLAGGIALITLGLVYIIPDIKSLNIPEELYYLMGGAAGLLIAVIILILGFRKAAGIKEGKVVPKEPASARQDPNEWNIEAESSSASRPAILDTKRTAISDTKAAIKIKEKNQKSGHTIICQKCGAENSADSYYCSGCKSALRKICKLCGHDNDYDTEICTGCGKVMN